MRMKKPLISQLRLRELLTYSPVSGVFNRLTDNNRGCHIGDVAGSLHGTGYINIYLDGKNYTAGRLAWMYMTGEWPRYDIDHVNGVKNDNRWHNLRDVSEHTNMQNERNVRKNNQSGFMGVHFRKERQKWVAQIRVDNKAIRLGSFDNPADAERAYLDAKRKLHEGFTI